MSDKRRTDEKPWEPTIEKMPTFNPFANNQNPVEDSDFATDIEELEEESDAETKPGKLK